MAAQKLIAEIVRLSVSNDWEEAKQEWSLQDVFMDEEPSTCLCGKYPIHENCVIRNRENNNVTTVGNHCVKEFLGLPSDKIFNGLRKIAKSPGNNLNEDAIDHAYDKGWLNDWERGFCLSMIGKRKITLSQSNKRIEINQKVLKHVSRAKPT